MRDYTDFDKDIITLTKDDFIEDINDIIVCLSARDLEALQAIAHVMWKNKKYGNKEANKPIRKKLLKLSGCTKLKSLKKANIMDLL